MNAPQSSDPERVERVTIDRSRIEDRWRYACPRGHSDWTPTRDHLWCTACARRRTRAGVDGDVDADGGGAGDVDADARYERVLDKKRKELLAYEGVHVE